MSNTKAWISAFRLRTLPLALAGIILGGFLAQTQQAFSWSILLLAMLTATLLQILSNLANDYGDFEKGTDNDNRVGPMRAMQSGAIDQPSMKRALMLFGALSLLSGVALLYISFGADKFLYALTFFAIGIAAIWAAIKYTVGKNAYGYLGLGDVFVFIFFGLVSVMGVYFLMVQSIDFPVLLPASVIGFLSAGVLNLNNTRDIENDLASGKNTLAAKLGLKNAKNYQYLLYIASVVASLEYTFSYGNGNLIGLTGLLPATLVVFKVYKSATHKELDPLLKVQAIGTLVYALLFGFSQML